MRGFPRAVGALSRMRAEVPLTLVSGSSDPPFHRPPVPDDEVAPARGAMALWYREEEVRET